MSQNLVAATVFLICPKAIVLQITIAEKRKKTRAGVSTIYSIGNLKKILAGNSISWYYCSPLEVL